MKDEMNLTERLFEIRKKLDYFKKDTTGNQKVKYVDPELILGKARKYMDEFRVLLVPAVLDDTMTKLSNPTSNQPDHQDFVVCLGMSMTWVNVDNPEDKLIVPWYATGSHRTDPSMAFGGSLTYTERYFILKFFQIPTGKDDPEFHKAKIEDPVLITEENAMDLRAMITEKGRDEVKFCSFFKVANVEDLFLCNYEKAVSMLERVK